MKKIYGVLAAVTLVIAMTGAAFATDTSNVVVTATIADTCTTIADGAGATISLDQLTGGDVTNGGVTTQPTIKCTKGSSHAVACTSSNAWKLQKAVTLETINYTLNAGSVCGTNITGNGSTAVPLTLGIDIASAAYANAVAGTYTDTITIEVTY